MAKKQIQVFPVFLFHGKEHWVLHKQNKRLLVKQEFPPQKLD